jgi:flagellar biosynthetic protein FliR
MPWDAARMLMLLPTLALILARIGGMVMVAPMLSSQVVPVRVRAYFAVAVGLCAFPLVSRQAPAVLGLADVVTGLAGEMMIGLVIGLAFGLVFTGADLAGQLVGQQIGLRAGDVLNPVFDSNSTAVGDLYFFFTLMIFFLIGGHHALMTALLETYRTTPLLSFTMSDEISEVLNELILGAFSFGVRLAAPVLITMFITELTMGFIARTMPQINILSIGFGVRVLVGLWITAAAIGAINALFAETFWDWAGRIATVLH